MVEKNKNNTISKIEQVATHAGIAVMLLATFASMAEIADREGHRVVGALQPSYAYVGQNNDLIGHGDETMRRGGREEVRHLSASYDTLKRSNAISGKL